jgi:acyl carrier protein
MNRQEIKGIISGILTSKDEVFQLPANKIDDKAHLIDDLGLDSLQCVDLEIAIEAACKVTLPDEEDASPRLMTLGEIATFIEAKQSTTPPEPVPSLADIIGKAELYQGIIA